MNRVTDIGEDALVEKLVAKIAPGKPGDKVIAGPGDDCAVVESGREGVFQLLKTDCVVEDVHFLPGTEAELVGRKAIGRTLSDIAAMGGIPRFALVTIALGSSREVDEVEGWYAGMAKMAAEYDVEIVGGETSALPGKNGAVISIAMTGEVERENCVYRRGAGAGDEIAVTGRLGNSFASGRHLDFIPRIEEARWMVAKSKNCRPNSMMDLSDGLAKDLPRLLKADGLGSLIDRNKIPVHADADLKSVIGEGEDYELLMTFSTVDRVEWKTAFPDTELTIIGEVTETPGDNPGAGGWEHFTE